MSDPYVALASLLVYGSIKVFIWVLLILLGRMIVLWYFRINQAIDLLQSIDDRLAKLDKSASANSRPQSQPVDHLRTSSTLR